MNSRLALPLVLFAALGASVLFWWMSSGAPSDRSVAEARRAADEARATRSGELATPRALDERSKAAEPTRMVSEPVAPGRAEAARADEEDERGRIEGTVVDRAGTPIAGATVLASNQLMLSLDADLPWSDRVQATTDDEGRFTLTGVDAGELHLGVRAASFAPYDRTDLSIPDDDLVRLEPIVLSAGAILTGHVIDPAGNGVPGAKLVNVSSFSRGGFTFFGGQREPVAVSASDGSFRVDQLACGEWSLSVETEEFPERVFKGLAEVPGEVVADLRFELEPGATISGRVTDVPDDEVGTLSVRATPAVGDWMQRMRSRSADVDRDGRFTLRGLRMDTEYDLRVRTRSEADRAFDFGGGESRSEAVRAWSGDEGVEIQYLPEAALMVQVVDSRTREPITRYTVKAGVNWMQLVRQDGRPDDEHPEGRARIGDLRPDGPDDRVELEIEATGYKSYSRDDIAVATGQELDLGTIFLDPVPVLRVTVIDRLTGDPVAGALVSLTANAPAGDERSFRMEASMDDDGHMTMKTSDADAVTNNEGVAVLTSLEGATCTLKVEADDFASFLNDALTLPKGESYDTVVELTEGGSVVVTVVDPKGEAQAGVRVSHRAPGEEGMMPMPFMPGTGEREVSDSNGRVRFANLAAGSHGFKIAEAGGGGMMMGGEIAISFGGDVEDAEWSTVDVVEGAESALTLEAAARGALAGRMREAGKILPGATIKLAKAGAGDTMHMGGLFGGPRGLSTRTNGDGEYLLESIDEGRYTLTVGHPTRRMPVEFEIDIREGSNHFDADLPLSILEGRLTTPDGEPVAGVSVRAEKYVEESSRVQRQMVFVMGDGDGGGGVVTSGDLGGESTATDADGRYTLRGVVPDIELVVRAEGASVQSGSSEPLRVAADETRRGVDLELEPAGSVSIEIYESDGTPAGFKMVRATWAGEGEVDPEVSFANDGLVTFDGLRPGKWILTASDPRPDRQGAGAEREVEIRAGEEAHVDLRFD